ncbi:hypothetical protein LJK87_20850 [Paenibacillus sp. P25]|nr:hypothetical protein LJK87_20850 [Paenibacillus sp. P25]
MYQTILGIDTDENRPGFKHSVIRPRPGGGLRFASGEFGSVYGQIRVEWRRDRSDFVMHVQIPVNTTATVYVPGAVRNGEELESRGLRSLANGKRRRRIQRRLRKLHLPRGAGRVPWRAGKDGG